MRNEQERRVFVVDKLVIETRADAEGKRIVGHAAVFDTWTELFDGFEERVAKGAFTDTIKEDDIRSLFNHDPNVVLGRNRAKTLTLREDDTGLYTETIPPDTQAARDLIVSIGRGDVSEMSFAFRTIKDSVEYDRGSDTVKRTIEKVKLYDVSPVTFPAYPTTDVGMRGLDAARGVFEECLAKQPRAARNRLRHRAKVWRSLYAAV
jgi:hypothetical protein